jgi:RNA polymerase sigma-70 factor, ECF subfamily
MNEPGSGVTRLLQRIRTGDDRALEELMESVYGELRTLARRQLRGRSGDQTIETTVLVHEAYLRLAHAERPEWVDRCHFFAVASTAMRQILVDHARRRGSAKRGGGWQRVDFESARLDVEQQTELLLEIDDALDKLTAIEPRLTRVVECRYFGGMTEAETAIALDVSERTVRRDWIKARAWLHLALGFGTEGEPGTGV